MDQQQAKWSGKCDSKDNFHRISLLLTSIGNKNILGISRYF